MPPNPEARLDLLERMQEQQMALNDTYRQGLATLSEALGTQQRTIGHEMRMLDELRLHTARQDETLAALLQRSAEHDQVLARLEALLQAIKDRLPRDNGHTEEEQP